MEKHYSPETIEEKWYRLWMENGAFHSDSSRGGEPYCIVIPPPNVTGILHMGHALNNTIQDIMVRWRRMQGRNVIWMPGTDHAGIATQNVVERALRAEGKSREDLGREKFLERVWEWRDEYGSTIVNQLKRLGASCDWDRERFTMDEGLSDAVEEVFVRLYDKGLIYKGNYIVNWCSRCHTALSDEESEHADENGKLYYLKYEVQGGSGEKEYIVVATTRPETLLGDVAVAINPEDERYSSLKDRKIILPVLGRELQVIEDEFVDPAFGTGIVKVTPAHDPNDFEMGQRHDLTPINVMNGDGTMNDGAGSYAGMDRFECRKKILEDLEAAGQVEKIEDHQHAVGHCYRCDTVVEPRLSPQWFVKMQPLAERALQVVNDGSVQFVPDRWTKVYQSWMENIRDWCISRQIWWGHRIPVFYCDACDHQWAAKGTPESCPQCSSADIRQDEDVLDTWFSSWLWPFSTYGWPGSNEDLKFYYPTNDLVTASEIIFFWVARMIMAGLEFMDEIPFSKVYIHGTVRDDKGLKMSKSLGNSIDPLTIIDEFSADALRFSLIMITATGQDVYLSNDKFEIGRNFGTKLWNAARFMQMNGAHDLEAKHSVEDLDPSLLGPDDKHILSLLQKAIVDCEHNLNAYRFNDAALVLYEFTWHQYCDWYVEYSKVVFYGDDEARKEQVRTVMNYVFSNVLRLLHPLMPFITEELWSVMGYAENGNIPVSECWAAGDFKTIMYAEWPKVVDAAEKWGVGQEIVDYVNSKHELVRIGRTLRTDFGVAPGRKVDLIIKPDSSEAAELLASDQASLISMLRAESLKIENEFDPGKAMPCAVSDIGSLYMPVEGLIDVEAEKKRLSQQLEQLEGNIARISAKLENENFVNKAPAEVVEQQRVSMREQAEKIDKVRTLIEALGE